MRLSRSEFNAIKAKAASRKEKAIAKRATLHWADRVKVKRSGSLWKWWRDRCDALWARAVRARDMKRYGDVCRIRKAKGCTVRNECGYHLIERNRLATRWDLEAGVAACGPCNLGEMRNRHLYAEHHKKIFGADFMADLAQKSLGIFKPSIPDFKELADHLMNGGSH
jgi:hypothetical protein